MHETTQGQVLDPVCGMMIDRDDAAATRDLDGDTYFFCSTSCADKFDADPAAYIAATRNEVYHRWHGTPPLDSAPRHETQPDVRP